MRITLGQSQTCVAIHHLLCVSDAVFRLSGVPDSASDQQDDPAVVWWWTSCLDILHDVFSDHVVGWLCLRIFNQPNFVIEGSGDNAHGPRGFMSRLFADHSR